MKYIFFMLLFLSSSFLTLAQEKVKKSKKDYIVELKTSLGDMYLILYDETPKHKVNFIKLIKEGFYDDLLFHRVIEGFMIQGGDPDSKNAKPGQTLGSGSNGYRVEAEFATEIYHKKGALAAARDNNPKKASSGCQFYIVQGKTYTDEELKNLEKSSRYVGGEITGERKETYKTIGGTPFLDQNYTVFGEVIKGLEVVDKIAEVETNSSDRPKRDVKMTMTLKYLPKKKITKLYGYKFED